MESCTAWYVGDGLSTVKEAWKLWSERVSHGQGYELMIRKNANMRPLYLSKLKDYQRGHW